jgi:hypothetical protein
MFDFGFNFKFSNKYQINKFRNPKYLTNFLKKKYFALAR